MVNPTRECREQGATAVHVCAILWSQMDDKMMITFDSVEIRSARLTFAICLVCTVRVQTFDEVYLCWTQKRERESKRQ